MCGAGPVAPNPSHKRLSLIMWLLRAHRAARSGWVVPLILFALAAFAPSGTNRPVGGGDESEIQRTLEAANWKPQHAALDWPTLRRFYASRNYRAAWSSDDQSNEALRVL